MTLFTDLTDTPITLSGQEGKIIEVNASGDGLALNDSPTFDNCTIVNNITTDTLNVSGTLTYEPRTIHCKQESDFPAPISGVICLVDNTSYMIDSSFTVTNKLEIPSGAKVTLDCSSLETHKMLYFNELATGAMIIGSDPGQITIKNLDIDGQANRRLLDIHGGSGTKILLKNTIVRNFAYGVGTIAGVKSYTEDSTQIINNQAVSGLSLTDVENIRFINGCVFDPDDEATSSITVLGSNSFFVMTDIQATIQPHMSLLNLIPTVPTGPIQITNNTFVIKELLSPIRIGKVFADGSLSERSPGVKVRNNIGQRDGRAVGFVDQRANLVNTNITTKNVYTDLDLGGVPTGTNIERFEISNTTTGELKYLGIEPFEGTVRVSMTCSSLAGSQEFVFRVVKNGLQVSGIIESATTLGLQSRSLSLSVPIKLETNDLVRLQVKNVDGTSDVLVSYISIDIQ